MFLSIIVPVYNVEKYLDTCLQSILNQGIDNYEILLIDDGSIDGSGAICDKYGQYYPNIKVIHQQNGGLSEARNTGIRNASGEYLLFIDSDDFIAKGALKRIYHIIEHNGDTDVLLLDRVSFTTNKSAKRNKPLYNEKRINNRQYSDVLDYLISLDKFPISSCTKMYRTKLIASNEIFFEKGIYSEDADWIVRVLRFARTFHYESFPYYYYRYSRQGSISNSKSEDLIKSVIYIIKKWARKDSEDRYQHIINGVMSFEYLLAIYNYSSLSKQKKKTYKKDIYEYKWLLNQSKNWHYRLLLFGINAFGLDFLGSMFFCFKKFKNTIAYKQKGK